MEGELVSSAPIEGRWARRAVLLRSIRISESAGEKILYGTAAASYIAVGVFVTEFVLSWVIAFAWLLLWVCGVPALVRRLRR
jgi:hypothetical protein